MEIFIPALPQAVSLTIGGSFRGRRARHLVQLAAVNPSDKFALVFKHLLETLFVERMDQNEEIFVRYMNDAQFQKVVTAWMAEEAYKRLRDRPDTVMDSEQATTS